MSRIMNVGLRPLRVGKFSTLVRPKNLLLLGGLFLLAVGILIFGLMQGSFCSGIGSRTSVVCSRKRKHRRTLYCAGYSLAESHHGIAMRGHVRYGRGRNAIHCT